MTTQELENHDGKVWANVWTDYSYKLCYVPVEGFLVNPKEHLMELWTVRCEAGDFLCRKEDIATTPEGLGVDFIVRAEKKAKELEEDLSYYRNTIARLLENPAVVEAYKQHEALLEEAVAAEAKKARLLKEDGERAQLLVSETIKKYMEKKNG